MAKRLINFRGTQDFARVEGRKPPAPTPGKGIIWSSCNSTFAGSGGKGGFFKMAGTPPKQKMSTGFGEPRQRQELRGFGTNLVGAGVLLSGTVISAPIGVPLALAGVAFAAYASTIKKVTFSKPCHTPSLPSGFVEPTFEEFHAKLDADQKAANAQDILDQQGINK